MENIFLEVSKSDLDFIDFTTNTPDANGNVNKLRIAIFEHLPVAIGIKQVSNLTIKGCSTTLSAFDACNNENLAIQLSWTPNKDAVTIKIEFNKQQCTCTPTAVKAFFSKSSLRLKLVETSKRKLEPEASMPTVKSAPKTQTSHNGLRSAIGENFFF
jgi:hypothetical protein